MSYPPPPAPLRYPTRDAVRERLPTLSVPIPLRGLNFTLVGRFIVHDDMRRKFPYEVDPSWAHVQVRLGENEVTTLQISLFDRPTPDEPHRTEADEVADWLQNVVQVDAGALPWEAEPVVAAGRSLVDQMRAKMTAALAERDAG